MNRHAVSSVLALVMLCGCATKPAITPVRLGEAIEIAVAQSPQAKGVASIRNDALGKDMLAGGGSGALAGGLWGLTCGPFAPLCIPLGAAAGVITGTAAGAVVGLTGELSEDKVVQIRARLLRMQQTDSMITELQSSLTERAREFWNLTSDQPSTVVSVELQDLLLTSTRDESVSCAVRVWVSVRQASASGASLPQQKLYEYVSPFSSVLVWLDESSAVVDNCIKSASQQVAAQIVSDLAGAKP